MRGTGRKSVAALAAMLALGLLLAAAAQAVTLRPGDVLVAHNANPAMIGKINPRTGVEVPVSSGGELVGPWGLMLTPNGRIYVADYDATAVIAIDPATGNQRIVSQDNQFAPVGIGRAPGGSLVVSDYDAGAVLSVDPATGARTPIVTDPLLDGAAELAVAPSGRIFVPTEGSDPGVYAVNPANGALTPLLTAAADSRVADPYSVAVAASGRRLLVADYDFVTGPGPQDGALLSLPVSGGAPSIISQDQQFGDPIGLARSWRGPLIVAEQDNPPPDGQVLSVNPATGAQRTLALATGFGNPGGVSVVPPRCFGRFATIVGGPRPDKLVGTRFRDVIAGAGAGDRIRGRGGRDLLCGGKGRDRLRGGPGRDRLRGGPGRDLLRGGPGRDFARQ